MDRSLVGGSPAPTSRNSPTLLTAPCTLKTTVSAPARLSSSLGPSLACSRERRWGKFPLKKDETWALPKPKVLPTPLSPLSGRLAGPSGQERLPSSGHRGHRAADPHGRVAEELRPCGEVRSHSPS